MNGRIISLGVAGVYLVGAYLMGGGEAAFRIGIIMIFPLACIWFSRELGARTGWLPWHRYISKPTPGIFVAIGGWALLAVIGVLAFLLNPRSPLWWRASIP